MLVTVCFCHMTSRKTRACHPRLVPSHLQPDRRPTSSLSAESAGGAPENREAHSGGLARRLYLHWPVTGRQGGLPGPGQLTAESMRQGPAGTRNGRAHPPTWLHPHLSVMRTWPWSRRRGNPTTRGAAADPGKPAPGTHLFPEAGRLADLWVSFEGLLPAGPPGCSPVNRHTRYS